MAVEIDDLSIQRRRLIVHDTLTLLSLVLVTAALFAVTLFLFRSFQAHRTDLARRWSDRGQAAMQEGHPDQAVVALRAALSYAPEERAYELLLAQALGEAGHTDESFNYFMGLRETTPGDGTINLWLARLAAKKGDRQSAVTFYRGAIYGTWEGDGSVRRRAVRLELARYLIAQHDYGSARTELLAAGGNAPDDPALAVTLGELLQQANDPGDALRSYLRALTLQPKNVAALEGAGRLQYAAGRFREAHDLLERALQEPGTSGDKGITAMAENSARIMALDPARTLPNAERVDRILKARELAKKRFDSCAGQTHGTGQAMAEFESLGATWAGKQVDLSRMALLRDTDAQQATVNLIYKTETVASQVCGAPAGDDALLLLLARSPGVSDE
jgi:Tfp pilus assembly protein PilF